MSKIKVSDYLIQELYKLGIKDFFGLPGDYCFNIVDSVQNNPNTKWIGCTNELNAGCAADGYARLNGYGALITTYNVGELSAMNPIGGCYSENVPVIHIVGAPKTKYIKSNAVMHHNFCEPDYYAGIRAFENYTEASAFLDEQNAKNEIERVISIMMRTKKPVYIAIPADICDMEIDNEPDIQLPVSDEKTLNEAVEHAVRLIDNSAVPVIIGDFLVERFVCKKEFNEFVNTCGIPVTTFIMGKGIIDENSKYFTGSYLGSMENTDVYFQVNNSDCPICVGTVFGDFNTLKYDIRVNPKDHIEILGTVTTIENTVYENVLMKDILTKLSLRVQKRNMKVIKAVPQVCNIEDNDNPLDFEFMFQRFQEFLKEDDCIFSDTGILNFFPPMLNFPRNARWYNQLLWASIGWATPALFGAMVAKPSRRMILLTGEGAHQLTIQSVSNMFYYNLKPIIFVLNNSGYTIERILSKDPKDAYNNIIPWAYTDIIKAFCKKDVFTAKVYTNQEFADVLEIAAEEQKSKLCYIELFTEEMELPYLVKKLYRRNKIKPE